MSWLNDIVDFGSSVLGFFTSNNIGAQIVKTAITGYAVNKINKSIAKDNEKKSTQQDTGNRIQLDPDTEARIPVVYGSAFVKGIITDARMSNNNQTMHFCLTLCERTGVKLSDNAYSVFNFLQVYHNDQLCVFESDGQTLKHLVDRTNTVNAKPAGQIRVYCYRGSSIEPTTPEGYTNPSMPPAYSIMPGWTANYKMSDLVFAIVRVDYSKEKDVTGLGQWEFKLRNTMTLPGDVIYDQLTNKRYGAGVPATEINV